MKITRKQRLSLWRLFKRVRVNNPHMDYGFFRQSVEPGPGCIMVEAFGMWFGIEPDGYTHT